MKISADKTRLFYDTHLPYISSSLCISGAKYVNPRLRDDVHDVLQVSMEKSNTADHDSISEFYGRNRMRMNPSDLPVGFYYTGVEDYVWCLFGGCGIKHQEMKDKHWNDLNTDNHSAVVVTSVTRIPNVLESSEELEYATVDYEEETRKRNGQRLCKMCRIKEGCMVFLAYCHLVSCDRCSHD